MNIIAQAVQALTDPLDVLYAFTVTLCERQSTYRAFKILHRVLLDKDMPVLKRLAVIVFNARLDEQTRKAAGSIVDPEIAQLKVLAIYSLVVGLIEHEPIWKLSSAYRGRSGNSAMTALFVLETIFPDVKSWSMVAARFRNVVRQE
jgi:hypothetical protein